MKRGLGIFFATLVSCLGATYAFNARYATSAPPLALMKTIAEAQHDHDVVVSDNTLYQRGWVRARVASDCVDVVVFGSSTVGTISREMLAPRSMLNAWAGNASVHDLESFTQILSSAKCRPRYVVLGVDLWWTGNPAWSFDGWQQLVDDYMAYQSAHGSVSALTPWRIRWDDFKEKLSFERTLDTLRAVRARGFTTDPRGRANLELRAGPEERICDTIHEDLNLRNYDGHYTKCPAALLSSPEVEKFCDEYLVQNLHNMADWREVSRDRIARLKTAVAELEAYGVDVVMVGMPYHPRAWAILMKDPTLPALIAEVDRELQNVATATKATFTSLRDPTIAGCVHGEFDDSHHPLPACAEKVALRIRAILGPSNVGGPP